MLDIAAIISRGREALNAGDLDSAERFFRDALRDESDSADALAGLGAAAFERGDLDFSRKLFEQAKESALRPFGGKLPDRVEWKGAHKPLLRAIQGIGLNQFRDGDLSAAAETFALLLRLNPGDNQGASGLLAQVRSGKSPWKKTD